MAALMRYAFFVKKGITKFVCSIGAEPEDKSEPIELKSIADEELTNISISGDECPYELDYPTMFVQEVLQAIYPLRIDLVQDYPQDSSTPADGKSEAKHTIRHFCDDFFPPPTPSAAAAAGPAAQTTDDGSPVEEVCNSVDPCESCVKRMATFCGYTL